MNKHWRRLLLFAAFLACVGGYFVWLQFPIGVNLAETLERASGVTAVLGPEFSAPASCMRLAYSWASPDEIEVGVERLAAAISATV